MSSKKRVLIVDDDASILEALELTLDSFGYETKTLSDGADIYRAVETYKPDVIILDLLLSGEDGTEICKKLKLNKRTKQIPVIVVSAHPDLAKLSKASGANDYLEKPFDLDALYSKVHAFA